MSAGLEATAPPVIYGGHSRPGPLALCSPVTHPVLITGAARPRHANRAASRSGAALIGGKPQAHGPIHGQSTPHD